MRTTLDIDIHILKAAKALAEAEHKTLGQVLSALVRKGLADAAGAPPLTGEPGRSGGPEDGAPALAADAAERRARRR